MSGRRRTPLKILHIDPEKDWGGGEYQVLGLSTRLAARGHRSHLMCHPDGALRRAAEAGRLTTLPIVLRNDFDLRPVLALRRLIRDQAYDIVHYHTKRAHALALMLGRAQRGSRYVVTRRMDYPVRRNWYTRLLYERKVDGVIAISNKIADILVAGGVGRGKIRVIHSGIDPEPFRTLGDGPDRATDLVVGTVAVLEPRKGHQFLLQAAALLKREGFRLRYRLAGEGSRRQELERMVRELGLETEVAFAGFVSDVPGFLSDVDLFVLPSLYEGLGVTVLEAMAAGKPVVASKTGGIPELVRDGMTGLLVPPRDPRALAKAMAELMSQNGLRREMGKKGREVALRDFTVETMASKNEEYYYELLGASQAASAS